MRRALPGGRVERVNGVTWYGWERPSCFVAVIQTGMGPANAMAACQAVLDHKPWTVYVSTGFAAALAPARIGDVVAPARVVCRPSDITDAFPDASVACSVFYRQKALDAAQLLGHVVLAGVVVTVRTVVCLAKDKRTIGRDCAAVGLDMESAAVGTVAARRGVPFVVLRTISDLAEEDLPLDLSLLSRPTLWRGVWALATTPGTWPALNRLRRHTHVASARLTKLFATFLPLSPETHAVLPETHTP